MTKSEWTIPVDLDSFKQTGWSQPDVTLITGDIYVDHPSFGIAIVARVLENLGLKVLVLSQPASEKDILLYPPPKYFFGITSGNLDSMVSNYTASGKPRKSDAYAYEAKKRPNRAVIVYSNWVKSLFKDIPIVIGGLEASLRRFGHYDWWQNKVRHSILLDSKADLLIFGMSELTLKSLVSLLKRGVPFEKIKYLDGSAFYTTDDSDIPTDYLQLDSFEQISTNTRAYNHAYGLFYSTNTTSNKKGIYQKDGGKVVVQNPPSRPQTQEELDHVYSLPYTKEIHPNLRADKYLSALEAVRTTIVTHRGCYGECNFCAIALHQGRTVQSRSISSIVSEVAVLAQKGTFNGTITDLGGPTANMYGYECNKKKSIGPCENKRCIFPQVCEQLQPNHGNYLDLLAAVSKVQGINHVFISSGIRPDLIYTDKINGRKFLTELILKHTSGYLKLAPEHFSVQVLKAMGKNTKSDFERIFRDFYAICRENDKKQFITAYLMVGHPGEGEKENKELAQYVQRFFRHNEQPVQIFTPTPSTISTSIFYTECDPLTGNKIKVIKRDKERNRFKSRALLKLREDVNNGENEGTGKRKTSKRIQAKGSGKTRRVKRR